MSTTIENFGTLPNFPLPVLEDETKQSRTTQYTVVRL